LSLAELSSGKNEAAFYFVDGRGSGRRSCNKGKLDQLEK
jgi:hypothetical protein